MADMTGRMGAPAGAHLPFQSRRRKGKKRYYKRRFNPGRPAKNFTQFKLPYLRFTGQSWYAQPFYVCSHNLTTMVNMHFSGQLTASLTGVVAGTPKKIDFLYAVVRVPENTVLAAQGLQAMKDQLDRQFRAPLETNVLATKPTPPSLLAITKYPDIFRPLPDVVCYGEGSVSVDAGAAITRHSVRHAFQMQQFMELDSLWFLLKTDNEQSFVDGILTARFLLKMQ